jgi:hypothetical protein
MKYPCYREQAVHNVRLQGDSLFTPTILSDLYSEHLAGFKGDTLVLQSDLATKYYCRKDYDLKIIDILISTCVNTECANGVWNVGSDYQQEYLVYHDDDTVREILPSQLDILNFSTSEFYLIQDIFYDKKSKFPTFRIDFFDYNKYYQCWEMWLVDLPKDETHANMFCYRLVESGWHISPN